MTRRLAGFGKPPKKGTKSRSFLLQALRPEGADSFVFSRSIGTNGVGLSRLAQIMIDQKGYDLRTFLNGKHAVCWDGRKGRPMVSWRLVGKMRWDGSYRSFIGNPE